MFARSGRTASKTSTHGILAAAALTLTFVGTTLAGPHPMQGSKPARVSDGIQSRDNSRWGGGWKIEIPRRDDHKDHKRSLDGSCLETCVRIDGHEVNVHVSITRDRRGEMNAKLTLSTKDNCELDIDAVTLKVTAHGEEWKETLDECNSRAHEELTFESKDGSRIKPCDDFKVSLRIYTESDDVDTASWRDVEIK